MTTLFIYTLTWQSLIIPTFLSISNKFWTIHYWISYILCTWSTWCYTSNSFSYTSRFKL